MPLSLRVTCIKTGLNAAGIKTIIQYIIIFNCNYIILDMSLSLSSLFRMICIKTGSKAAGIVTIRNYYTIEYSNKEQCPTYKLALPVDTM